MLMELWFDRKMEYVTDPAQIRQGQSNFTSKVNALQEWIQVDGDDLPRRILQAVSLCTSLDRQHEDKVALELLQMAEDLAWVSKAFN